MKIQDKKYPEKERPISLGCRFGKPDRLHIDDDTSTLEHCPQILNSASS